MNTCSRDSKEATTIFAVPVKVDGKVMGVLYANLDLETFARETVDRLKLAKTGVCFIYADDGLLLMHPDREKVGSLDGEQQSASSEEINQSIMQVDTIAGETARAMEEASRVVSELANQAQVLTGLIEDMKQN